MRTTSKVARASSRVGRLVDSGSMAAVSTHQWEVGSVYICTYYWGNNVRRTTMIIVQCYELFTRRVNEPASSSVALSTKRMPIFSLLNAFVIKILSCVLL